MPTDELIIEWPASVPEAEVRAAVSRRARAIRLRRRLPVALVAGISAVSIGMATLPGGDQTSLRTADRDLAADERREVEAGGNRASVSARVWNNPGGAHASASVDVPASATSAGGEIKHRVPPTIALTGHPLVLDPRGDAEGPESLPPVKYGYLEATDILSLDYRLTGDTLEGEAEMLSLAALDDGSGYHSYWFKGVVHGDIELWMSLTIGEDGTVVESAGTVRWISGVGQTSTGNAPFAVEASVDPTNNRVFARTTLAEVNRVLANSENFSVRRTQGDVLVRAGLPMAQLSVATFGPTDSPGVRFQHDTAESASGEYWEIGS